MIAKAKSGDMEGKVTAADAIKGKDVLGGLFNAGANPAIDPLLAVIDFTVSSGSGSDTMSIMTPPYDIWVGTGGSSYDVYLWVDMNGNRSTVQYPESGVDMRYRPFPLPWRSMATSLSHRRVTEAKKIEFQTTV